MKLSVVQKDFKIAIGIFLGIMWGLIFALIIFIVVASNETLTPSVIIVEVLIAAMWLVVTIVLIRICLVFVTINEQGVKQCIGERVINAAQWNEIAKIELVEFAGKGVRRLYINAILTTEKSKAKTGNIDMLLFDKNKISVPYSKAAYEAIKQYYDNDVCNSYLVLHYDDNGKPL